MSRPDHGEWHCSILPGLRRTYHPGRIARLLRGCQALSQRSPFNAHAGAGLTDAQTSMFFKDELDVTGSKLERTMLTSPEAPRLPLAPGLVDALIPIVNACTLYDERVES